MAIANFRRWKLVWPNFRCHRPKIRWKTRFRGPFLQRRPLTRRKIAIVIHHNPLFRSHCCSFLLKTCFWYVFVRVIICCKHYKHTCGCFRTVSAHKHKQQNSFCHFLLQFSKKQWTKWCCGESRLQFFYYLETSNAKNDLRNAFFSKFWVDPCLADFFFKVIPWRKLKIEKRSDFFFQKTYILWLT